MTTSCLQEKIDKLQNTVHALLHKSNYMAGVYVDDLARLNNEIHEQINDLYPCHGKTAEQEAALCLSLLMDIVCLCMPIRRMRQRRRLF